MDRDAGCLPGRRAPRLPCRGVLAHRGRPLPGRGPPARGWLTVGWPRSPLIGGRRPPTPPPRRTQPRRLPGAPARDRGRQHSGATPRQPTPLRLRPGCGASPGGRRLHQEQGVAGQPTGERGQDHAIGLPPARSSGRALENERLLPENEEWRSRSALDRPRMTASTSRRRRTWRTTRSTGPRALVRWRCRSSRAGGRLCEIAAPDGVGATGTTRSLPHSSAWRRSSGGAKPAGISALRPPLPPHLRPAGAHARGRTSRGAGRRRLMTSAGRDEQASRNLLACPRTRRPPTQRTEA